MSELSQGEPSRGDSLDVLDSSEISLLDTVDNLLNRGVVLTGEVVIGLAGIDLIYLQLSAVLCAADRILPKEPE
ncbi:MAG TPA: gas vesicle protein [Thermoanaerobaculia bacterium]|nr:gas vesicle protein [Thermoanaerobaculia bacterium]